MRGVYLLKKIYRKIFGLDKYLLKQGCKIGDSCHIYSDISTTESYLISIGNNVTISNDVQFITHDNSICKIDKDKSDIFGKISIGDDCFIGAQSIIMYGVTLSSNTIVAAGSVVTKSVMKEGMIIGGNPARIIGKIDDLRGNKYAININGKNANEKRILIEKNCSYTRKEMK